jgi:ABC-type branched-subunit amino acid transport system substrate-binding protein
MAAQQCNLASVESLRDALLKVQDYDGVSGKMSFLPNGDVLKPVELHIIENGRSVPLKKNSEGK